MIDRNDLRWYRDAIIYQLHVKSFFDANNDGVGDFAGLTELAARSTRRLSPEEEPVTPVTKAKG